MSARKKYVLEMTAAELEALRPVVDNGDGEEYHGSGRALAAFKRVDEKLELLFHEMRCDKGDETRAHARKGGYR